MSKERLSQSELLIQNAWKQMDELEKGAISNHDENRMVGHYWLRNSQKSPSPEIQGVIANAIKQVQSFATDLHQSNILSSTQKPFKNVLLIGIGGSALGPQLLYEAFGYHSPLRFYFLDNTDPDGFDQTLGQLQDSLDETLCIVISKSGGTKETRNALIETQHVFSKASLPFAQHAVAITQLESQLYQQASAENWLQTFPLWDWVGGRTSLFAPVGLLPAALMGVNIADFLQGAALMDSATRVHEVAKNPAMRMALTWLDAFQRNKRQMVILPYKDRISTLSRYLQQLIMESLGKETVTDGSSVENGFVVYGNKGSTDQHAYIQQLREGLSDFFVNFVAVLKDRDTPDMEVEPSITSGDYLMGFLLGTRSALQEKGRESITLTLQELTPTNLGAVLALYERAVGFYAFLTNINAYHQPGVEAGKKAASQFLQLQKNILQHLKQASSEKWSLSQIVESLDLSEHLQETFLLLEHLHINGRITKITEGPDKEPYYQWNV